MIFNFDKVLTDGSLMTRHKVHSRSVDMRTFTVRAVVRSFADDEAALLNQDFAEFYVEIPHTKYDMAYLENLETQVQTHEWFPNDIVFVPPPPRTLDDVKADKSLELNLVAQNQIYAGYYSDALVSTHLYPAKDKDQTNMVASVTDSYNPLNGPNWVTPFWCADVNGVWAYRLHSAAQIQRAGSEGKFAILVSLSKNAQLQAQVSAATTEAEVSAIGW